MQPNDFLAARIMLDRHRDLVRAAYDARIARGAPQPRPLGLRGKIADALASLAHRIDPESVPAPRSTITG